MLSLPCPYSAEGDVVHMYVSGVAGAHAPASFQMWIAQQTPSRHGISLLISAVRTLRVILTISWSGL
jgi:hypothetical protein